MIDLSWRRKKEIIWLGRYHIDERLIHQCAYYPRPPGFESSVSPCVRCSIERPRADCKYSHILTFSERVESKSNISRLLNGLSEEDKVAISEYLKHRKEVSK